jgi:hypothetical protein
MPIQVDGSAANHVVVRATGKLTKDELAQFRTDFERLVHERGKLRILFDATEFTGWDSGALWQEAKFDIKHFADIARVAIVGSRGWQKTLEAATNPFVRAEMRYFDASEMNAAKDWLVRP